MARPDLGKKWNYVVDFWSDPCDAPFTAYAEAAYPALLNALISYYAIDAVNIFTGWVRPGGPFKGSRSGSHGRGNTQRGKSRSKGGRLKKVLGFDPNDFIGRHLPGAEELSGRQVPNGAATLWHLYGAQQSFMNWMMIYQLTEDFFYEWMSGVAASVYCQSQRDAVFSARTETEYHLGILVENPLTFHEIDKIRNCTALFNNGVGDLPRTYSAGVSWGEIVPWEGTPEGAELELILMDGNGYRVSMNVPIGSKEKLFYARNFTSNAIYFRTRSPYSFTMHNLTFDVYGHQDEPPVRRKGWKDLLPL